MLKEWGFDKDKAARYQVNLLSLLRAGVFVAGSLRLSAFAEFLAINTIT